MGIQRNTNKVYLIHDGDKRYKNSHRIPQNVTGILFFKNQSFDDEEVTHKGNQRKEILRYKEDKDNEATTVLGDTLQDKKTSEDGLYDDNNNDYGDNDDGD